MKTRQKHKQVGGGKPRVSAVSVSVTQPRQPASMRRGI